VPSGGVELSGVPAWARDDGTLMSVGVLETSGSALNNCDDNRLLSVMTSPIDRKVGHGCFDIVEV
jgi:hypothetical protein